MTSNRQHIARINGIPPAGVDTTLPARRASDRDRQHPRILVYVEHGRIDVITVGEPRLDADGALELAIALTRAAELAR